MTHKHAPDPLLRGSGLQALKVILEKNEPRESVSLARFVVWVAKLRGYLQVFWG